MKIRKSFIFGIFVLVVVLAFSLSYFLIDEINSYGFRKICKLVGGIWCYWPAPLLKFVLLILIAGAVVFLIIHAYKKIVKNNK